jgi:hypothetical protein
MIESCAAMSEGVPRSLKEALKDAKWGRLLERNCICSQTSERDSQGMPNSKIQEL